MSEELEPRRSSWTCEIAAGDLADVAQVHMDFWEREAKKSVLASNTIAVENLKNWKRWRDFLESIEPAEKLRLNINDYATFYDEFLDRRKGLS